MLNNPSFYSLSLLIASRHARKNTRRREADCIEGRPFALFFTEMLSKKLNPGSAAELRFSPVLGCLNIEYIAGFVLFSMFLVCVSLLFSDILAYE
jgi:hypothetical protein